MVNDILKEMRSRGAFHCALGIHIDNREILAADSDIAYFETDRDFAEWCDLQRTIHDDACDVAVYAVHRV